ncbi:unnamed protein product [Toxocara canis]|uniref:Uncharacterized protein n=1 Tax=Toxocara canis TaxID=6265 RepID=A0A183TYA0_TOXCA|nr:unnamed protein product [Toxocara canis]
MSTPDDPVIHSPPSLRGAAPSALLAGSPGAALGSLAGRQQNGGVGVPSIAGALQATAGMLSIQFLIHLLIAPSFEGGLDSDQSNVRTDGCAVYI